MNGMPEELDFRGATVIVTGAGRGIGRAEAELFGARGANVVVADLGTTIDGTAAAPDDPAEETAAAIRAGGGSAVAVRASVAEEEGAALIVRTALDAFGGIDAVVNNAGNFAVGDFRSLDRATYQRFLDVHYFGSLEVTRQAWDALITSGRGRVVNTVSSALWGVKDMVHYGSAKGAVLGLTHNLAVAGAEHGIRVNAIAPGAATRMADVSAPSLPAETMERIRTTMPAELVAPVAVYLAHESCELTGEVLSASGGGVSRLVTVRTPGIRDAALTPETLRDRVPEVMELTGSAPHETTARTVAYAKVLS